MVILYWSHLTRNAHARATIRHAIREFVALGRLVHASHASRIVTTASDVIARHVLRVTRRQHVANALDLLQ